MAIGSFFLAKTGARMSTDTGGRWTSQMNESLFLDLSSIADAGWWSKQLYYASNYLMDISDSLSSQACMGVTNFENNYKA